MKHFQEKLHAFAWLRVQSETLFELCSATDEILDLLAEKDLHRSDGTTEANLSLVVMPFLRKRALLESIILGCAKAREDCFYQIKLLTGVKTIDINKLPKAGIRFKHVEPGIRGMANLIKHQLSTISLSHQDHRAKKDSQRAITAFGLPDGTTLDNIVTCPELYAKIDPLKLICENYVFLADVYCHFFKFKQMHSELTEISDVLSVFTL